MKGKTQSKAERRLKALNTAIEAFAKFLKGEISRAALNVALKRLETTEPLSKR